MKTYKSEYPFNIYGANGEYQVISYVASDVPIDSALQVAIGEQLLEDDGPTLATLLANLDLEDVLGDGSNGYALDTDWLYGCDLKKTDTHATQRLLQIQQSS